VGERVRVALCAVAKNEGIYLHEWIAYHRVIGFEEVLVYDNGSTDGSRALLSALSDQGLVRAYPSTVRDDEWTHYGGYRDAVHRLGREFGWVAFADIDEFVVLPRHRSIAAFVDEFADLGAIGINWKLFGSSGHRRYEPAPVIDRFRGCSIREYERNRLVKPIVRTDVLNRPPRPHTPGLVSSARYVDVTGEPIRNRRTRLVHHETIRLNHYFTKSREEWQWKRSRGARRGHHLPWRDPYRRFAWFDRNEEVEADILGRLPEVMELMERTRPVGVSPRLPSAPEP